jgi:hypothetical protein
LRKAIVNHGISLEPTPSSNKQKEQSAVVKQNGRFVGIAKKKNHRQVNSIQPNEPTRSDSNNETQQQAHSMIVIKPKSKKEHSPRSMNKMLVGYTRHDHKDAACNRERERREAVVERESSSDYVEARMSIDGSLQENLFCDNNDQDLQQIRDAMNAQEEVSDPPMDDSNICEQESAGP